MIKVKGIAKAVIKIDGVKKEMGGDILVECDKTPLEDLKLLCLENTSNQVRRMSINIAKCRELNTFFEKDGNDTIKTTFENLEVVSIISSDYNTLEVTGA